MTASKIKLTLVLTSFTSSEPIDAALIYPGTSNTIAHIVTTLFGRLDTQLYKLAINPTQNAVKMDPISTPTQYLK